MFDFDGVLTDNRVYVDQDGRETVACNRSDGLAFEALRAKGLRLFIVSRETNNVVSARAAKLKVPCLQSTLDKVSAVEDLCTRDGIDLGRVLYVGNDLNDFHVMQACGHSACPSDSHPLIRKIAKYKLRKRGGDGVVFELAERILRLDFLTYLEGKRKGISHA